MSMPESVNVPVPVLTSEPPVDPWATQFEPLPQSLITPVTVVLRLLPPTVTWLDPRKNTPSPSIEPALSLWSLFGPVLPEKSINPAVTLIRRALLPLLLPRNITSPLPLLVIVPPPAELKSPNRTMPLLLFVMAALPAVLLLKN